MAIRALSGPRLPPARGSATHLVVLLHGYGADGNDLIGLAPHWQRALPTVAFVAPNAPEPCAGAPMGYQWFPISRLDPHEMQRGVESAARVAERVPRRRTQAAGTAADRLALVGFSQGTMMSLHVGLAPRGQARLHRGLFRHAGGSAAGAWRPTRRPSFSSMATPIR